MSSEVSTKTQMKKSTGGKSGKSKKLTKKQLEAQKVEQKDTQEETPVVEIKEKNTEDVQLGGGEEEAAPVVEEQSGGGKKTKSKKEKKEKAPKKPRAKTAYNFFVSENMKSLMSLDEWKDKKNSELMKECGARWKSCSQEDKAPYQKMSDDHKAELLGQSS